MPTPGRRPAALVLHGVIAAGGFASGDRIVVGHWWSSPIGAFTDVMWATPDGATVLYAPDGRVARFVSAVYRFDHIEVVAFRTRGDDRRLVVELGERQVTYESGRAVPFPALPGGRRPRWVTRRVEAPIARRTLGVRPYGTSPTGVREWYQAQALRWVRAGSARIGGRDLGPLAPVDPPVGVGFSEPPRRPSMVRLHTVLVDPTGRLPRVAGLDGPPA